jgi:hypothetical protein
MLAAFVVAVAVAVEADVDFVTDTVEAAAAVFAVSMTSCRS